jgi:hypothetical protein
MAQKRDGTERDRHSNHIADTVRFGITSSADRIELGSEYRCKNPDCGNAVMVEVTLVFQSAVPPGHGIGVKGRIRCGKCGRAARARMVAHPKIDRYGYLDTLLVAEMGERIFAWRWRWSVN